jgi:two-component system chemotaxis response regulator CheB
MDRPEPSIPEEVPQDGHRYPTSLACPDCAGTLTVERRGGCERSFRCRVGHLYALPELLAGKERRLELRLWSTVAALDELAALLRDLGLDPDRRRRAERHAAQVRQIIEESVPLLHDGLGGDPDPDREEGA